MRLAWRLSLAAAVMAACTATASAETRAVVVGIDAYRNVKPLKGAVADAHDIAAALRGRGLAERNIKLLIDEQANRDAILAAIDEALAALKSGDLFILTFAGHGASEQWGRVRPPTISEGDIRTSFVLGTAIIPNAIGEIDRQLKGSGRERIISTELNARLAQFEKKKIRVVWVADTCHGGGLTRQVATAPGMQPLNYREIPPYRFKDGQDPLETVYQGLPKPVNPDADLSLLTFLAAVDKKTRAPEVPIPAGSNAMRGALSYSFARIIDGTARIGPSPALTRGQLFGYLKPSIRQLTDNKQVPDLKPLGDFGQVVLDLEKDFPGPAPGGGAQGSAAMGRPPADKGESVVAIHGLDAAAMPAGRTGLAIKRATSAAEADLVIDRQRVLRRNGDVLAAAFSQTDLVGMAEREVALRRLQAMAVERPRDIRLADGDRHYRAREKVEFIAEGRGEAQGAGPEHFLFFNIAYNGVVQHLLPARQAASARLSPDQSLAAVCVTRPFGADLAVLVTSSQPMSELIEFIAAADNQPMALEAVEKIRASFSPQMRIGLQGLYTLAEDAREAAHPKCP